MPRQLTESQRQTYSRDGLLFPVPVLSPAETERYRAACDGLEARLGGKPRTVEVRQMHLHFPWAHELAAHPAVLDAVEDLLGPDLLIWATELFAKHPRDATVAIGWHRDQPYLGLTGGGGVTAWVALGPSTPANGCMRVWPRPAERAASPKAPAAAGPRRDSPPPGAEAGLVDVTLGPGEMSLHAADVVHGSLPNLSDKKRVGFVIRFVTPDARPAVGRPPALLARGRDRHDHFDRARPPGREDEALALAAMRESAGRHLDAVLANLRHARC
jgi:ectoine hydroxylase-related dioxygenase (phytanoyl-CoA dioxygenase family)